MKYRDKKNFIIVLLLLTVSGLLGAIVMMANKVKTEGENAKTSVDTKTEEIDSRNLGAKNKLMSRKERNETYHIGNNDGISPALLLSEANYESTFRSCLGKNCFDEPVVREGKTITRIGLLAPPLSGAETILAMIRKVGLNDNKDVEVVLNTHVPAYGYGKNHGWSRIIRLVRRLVPHTHALVTSKGLDDSAKISASVDLQTRQLMRWHCRLSHVAAHTSMLTIFIDDFIERPVVELEKIMTFSGFKAQRQDLLAAVSELQSQLLKDLHITTSSTGQVGSDGAVISSVIMPQNLHDVYTTTIDNEMKISKELTKWPCKSFKELEGKDLAGVSLLPIRYYELSADCSDKHVKCSVQYDVNEQK